MNIETENNIKRIKSIKDKKEIIKELNKLSPLKLKLILKEVDPEIIII